MSGPAPRDGFLIGVEGGRVSGGKVDLGKDALDSSRGIGMTVRSVGWSNTEVAYWRGAGHPRSCFE